LKRAAEGLEPRKRHSLALKLEAISRKSKPPYTCVVCTNNASMIITYTTACARARAHTCAYDLDAASCAQGVRVIPAQMDGDNQATSVGGIGSGISSRKSSGGDTELFYDALSDLNHDLYLAAPGSRNMYVVCPLACLCRAQLRVNSIQAFRVLITRWTCCGLACSLLLAWVSASVTFTCPLICRSDVEIVRRCEEVTPTHCRSQRSTAG
jgi:hypothetical protein